MVMWGVGEDEMKGRHGLPTTITHYILYILHKDLQTNTSTHLNRAPKQSSDSQNPHLLGPFFSFMSLPRARQTTHQSLLAADLGFWVFSFLRQDLTWSKLDLLSLEKTKELGLKV